MDRVLEADASRVTIQPDGFCGSITFVCKAPGDELPNWDNVNWSARDDGLNLSKGQWQRIKRKAVAVFRDKRGFRRHSRRPL
ncbi:hypothetical protein CL631_01690 [bacterium]|jgi:hypothetical protein|nr:hypothetical protein [bacterium]